MFLPGESQGREAWWAAVYGVAQSRTRLKRLSSSSSSIASPIVLPSHAHRTSWSILAPFIWKWLVATHALHTMHPKSFPSQPYPSGFRYVQLSLNRATFSLVSCRGVRGELRSSSATSSEPGLVSKVVHSWIQYSYRPCVSCPRPPYWSPGTAGRRPCRCGFSLPGSPLLLGRPLWQSPAHQRLLP